MTSPAEDGPLDAPLRGTKILGALVRAGDLGATAQASVPGAYAWFVTVGPVAFAHGSPPFAKLVAACGIAALAGAPIIERKCPNVARILSVWGLVFTSLLVWIAVPSAALSPLRIDVVRGLAGLLGWSLFGLASAAPAVARRWSSSSAATVSHSLRPRTRARPGDAAILWIGFGLAALTQAVGWRVVEPERAVLVRLLGLAGGLAAVNAAASIVAARHVPRTFDSPRRRARRAGFALASLGLLLLAGAVVALTLWH